MTITAPRKMKRGDLFPDLRILITSGDPAFNPDAIASVRVAGAIDGTVVFDRAATPAAVEGGVLITMPFEATDTDEAGRVVVEVELTWPGNKTQTIRTGNHLLITPDIS